MKAPKVMLSPRRSAGLLERQHIDANLTNFISWSRLIETMIAAGEIKSSEEVEAFVLEERGIQYYVRRRR